MSFDKKPAIDRGGVLKTDCKAIDKPSLPDQMKTVKTSETPLKTIFDVLLDNTKNINHGTVSLELHIRDNRPWRFEISRNESFILGFEKPDEAGAAYKKAVKQLHGKFARVNDP